MPTALALPARRVLLTLTALSAATAVRSSVDRAASDVVRLGALL